jgi:hypothetical protein
VDFSFNSQTVCDLILFTDLNEKSLFRTEVIPDEKHMAYQELCKSYLAIDDFRTKLLASLPLVSGAGFFFLLNVLDPSRPLSKSSLWRATGITIYLENDGRLEHPQQMAGHESPRTTKLYDRTKDEITLSEVERIRL